MPPAVLLPPAIKRGAKVAVLMTNNLTRRLILEGYDEIGILGRKEIGDQLVFIPFYNIIEVEF